MLTRSSDRRRQTAPSAPGLLPSRRDSSVRIMGREGIKNEGDNTQGTQKRRAGRNEDKPRGAVIGGGGAPPPPGPPRAPGRRVPGGPVLHPAGFWAGPPPPFFAAPAFLFPALVSSFCLR